MSSEKRSPRPAATGRGHSARGTALSETSISPAERLLQRLDAVRETAPGQWLARCPAHDDRSPSLSLKELDGRVLVHCFAGCEAGEIVAMAGLRLSDLFEQPLAYHRPPATRFERRRYVQAAHALRGLEHEVIVVYVLAEQMGAGFALDPAERSRLRLAVQRLKAAAEVTA